MTLIIQDITLLVFLTGLALYFLIMLELFFSKDALVYECGYVGCLVYEPLFLVVVSIITPIDCWLLFFIFLYMSLVMFFP